MTSITPKPAGALRDIYRNKTFSKLCDGLYSTNLNHILNAETEAQIAVKMAVISEMTALSGILWLIAHGVEVPADLLREIGIDFDGE